MRAEVVATFGVKVSRILSPEMILQLLKRGRLFRPAVVIWRPTRSPVIAAVAKETDRRLTGGKAKNRGKDLRLTRKDDNESHELGERGSTPGRRTVTKNDEASLCHRVRTAPPAGSNAVKTSKYRRRNKY